VKRQARQLKHQLLKPKLWQTRIVFWGGAMLVGVIAAVFAILSDYADLAFKQVIAYNIYLPLIITPLGLLFTMYVTRTLFPGTEGSGVPQSLASIKDRSRTVAGRYLTFNIAISKILLCVGGLLCGASLGRVGPTVHIGAAIMYSLGKYMHFRKEYVLNGLNMAGGGAGIAAAFNLPIAGIMFAIEEMGRSFDRRSIGMILVAIVLASMVSILVHESDYHFAVVATVGSDIIQLGIIVVTCGVIGGLIGGGFSYLLITVARKISSYTRKHWVITTLLCGFGIAVTGILSGGVAFGSGYMETKALVACAGQQVCTEHPGILFPLYKIIATVLTFISGVPAGLFVPVLATGAGIGSDIAMLFPVELASTILLIGMVAYFSAVFQTPVTAFIVVIEVTDNNELVFALMVAALIASGISKMICTRPLFKALAENLISMMSDNSAVKNPVSNHVAK
jgi:H+/Cl- antiporter ClcA